MDGKEKEKKLRGYTDRQQGDLISLKNWGIYTDRWTDTDSKMMS
jgi:hypothetical protein